jgi:hypothetical protein
MTEKKFLARMANVSHVAKKIRYRGCDPQRVLSVKKV